MKLKELNGGDSFVYDGETYYKLITKYRVKQESCCNPPKYLNVNTMTEYGMLRFIEPETEVDFLNV